MINEDDNKALYFSDKCVENLPASVNSLWPSKQWNTKMTVWSDLSTECVGGQVERTHLCFDKKKKKKSPLWMSAPLETLGWPGIRKLKARIQEFWCILLTLILKNGMLFTQLWCIKNWLPFTPCFSVYLSMPPWQFSILYPIL